jgi:hypothetical protein
LFTFNPKAPVPQAISEKNNFFLKCIVVLLIKKYERTLSIPPTAYQLPPPPPKKNAENAIQLCKIADDAELKERRFRRTEAEEGEL